MALFGKADIHQPLLTQFYQLEFDPQNSIGSELDQWLYRIEPRLVIKDNPTVIKQMTMERFNGGLFSADSWINSYEGEQKRNTKSEVEWLAHFHPILKAAMNAAADNEEPTDDLLKNLNQAFETFLRIPQVFWGQKPSGGEGMYIRMQFWGPFFAPELLYELIEAIKKENLRRCLECGNVFVRNNPKAVFCSHRCGDRVYKREFRRELSDEF